MRGRIANGIDACRRRTGLSPRALFDLVLLISGVVYLGLLLALNLTSPIFSVAFVAGAGYELFAGHGHGGAASR